VRLREVWRVSEEHLQSAQDDATLLAIRDMERAGIDIISDGETRRESYSNHFASALEGVDIDRPGIITGRIGKPIVVPRAVGRIRRPQPIGVRDASFLRANTDRTTKMTLPGPFTMAQQVQDDFYGDEEEMAMDYAAAVNQEILDLKNAGIDVVQIDEPWLQARPQQAARYGVRAINRALEGVPGPTVVHVCFGYAHLVHDKPSGYSVVSELAESTADHISIEAAQPGLDPHVLGELSGKTILLGVISLAQAEPETAEEVAARIRAALAYVPAERLIPAPDCGMKYLDRATAFAKLRALAEGAAIVRRELAG
jgi:5-methyltetrahydropteroyltriglutamate--homocysteine methyltransferase